MHYEKMLLAIDSVPQIQKDVLMVSDEQQLGAYSCIFETVMKTSNYHPLINSMYEFVFVQIMGEHLQSHIGTHVHNDSKSRRIVCI
mmetsp:Transcript_443/g.472  ORF Transcript_443/g.472 Transcript_443/m.472 type:complete len:86 (-) Transcript_443:656-913(-)